ncbi:recombinase family protein [Neoroseomonas lacus]|uniref:Resolvase n=1 Tax=Neoroseomonas lacus TaxID=287609 RepID=A0A917NY77_9PROT|nr:recombinase family protein [Neoroseomonas lacus]GGJ40892.1 resolvase [Neoroseomonas lacus]
MTPRCAIYARYSSENQREASIEDQLRLCTARAEREGWTIAGSFTDAAISGATTLRPGYQALLEAMRGGTLTIVLAESLDRFSRDLEHVAAFHKLARFCQVQIVTLSEGEVSEMAVGFKGTMGALSLRDLSAKTHRGLEGRVRQGRGVGAPPYGYRVVRHLGADGEPERGLREIDPERACVVRRIYRDYVAGLSPLVIARALNSEGVPAPRGGTWYDLTLRGRPGRGDGILRNPLYVGRMIWNRQTAVVDPRSGTQIWRAKAPEAHVEAAVPDLRIVPDDVWNQAQARLGAEAAPRLAKGPPQFWERRRPRHLLTGKVVCGCCGRGFTAVGQDYLACRAARNGSGCRNARSVRRSTLEARVLDALGRQLMRPDLVAAFCAEFITEWNRLAAEASAGAEARQRELQAIERKLTNLVEAIADGLKATGIQQKLVDLETRQAELKAAMATEVPAAPALHPDIAQVYAERVAELRQALDADDGSDVLEAARALVDTVVVSPPDDPGEPPIIELTGNLIAMLKAGGARLAPDDASLDASLTGLLSRSVKGGARGSSLPRCFLLPHWQFPTDPAAQTRLPSVQRAPPSIAPDIFAPDRLAPVRLASVRSARNSVARRRSAPMRMAC